MTTAHRKPVTEMEYIRAAVSARPGEETLSAILRELREREDMTRRECEEICRADAACFPEEEHVARRIEAKIRERFRKPAAEQPDKP